jgi:hypothetical protein
MKNGLALPISLGRLPVHLIAFGFAAHQPMLLSRRQSSILPKA